MSARTIACLALPAFALCAGQANAQTSSWYYTPDYSGPAAEEERIVEVLDDVDPLPQDSEIVEMEWVEADTPQLDPPLAEDIYFVSEPVVQPVPMAAPATYAHQPTDAASEVEEIIFESDPVAQPTYEMAYADGPVAQRAIGYHKPQLGYSEAERDAWLAECRRRYSDNGLGGALIGGVIGGIAGNRIAGEGNRTVGTIAGAVTGAVAGAAIDKAEDRERVRDDCESYLERYEAGYGQQGQWGYGGYGYGYGYPYGQAVAYVPVMLVQAHPHPVERRAQRVIVIEEVVEEEPAARRVISRPAKTVRSVQPAPKPTKTVRYVK